MNQRTGERPIFAPSNPFFHVKIFRILFTFRNFLAAGLLVVSAAACTKKEDPAPGPTTGGIEGIITPANALTEVTATNAGGLTFPAVLAASGFTVANLGPGTYTLTFEARTGFLTPVGRTVAVVAGQTATAGTVVVRPEPPGSITGTISPAGAVTLVEVTGATGTLTSAVPGPAGNFSVSATLGTSSVRFVMAPRFVQVPNQTVTLTATAPTAALGTISATPQPATGSLTYDINGQPYVAATTTVAATTGGILRIEGLSPNASTPTKIVLSAGNFAGVGTYTLGGAAANNFGQLIPLQSPQSVYQTSTTSPGGTLTVSAYNAAARTITGTFSFTTQTPATVLVTNGQFNLTF